MNQAAALLNVRHLCGAGARVVLNVVDILYPDRRQHKTKAAHEPEATPPTRRVRNPAQDGTEDHQRKASRRVKGCRGTSTLVGGKPGGNDAAIARENRCLGKPGDQSQNKYR